MAAPNPTSLSKSTDNTMDSLIFGLKASQVDVNADIDRLAHRLSETHFPQDREMNAKRRENDGKASTTGPDKKAWIYFPPGTTLDEQLLILGGGETLLQCKSEGDTDFASTENVQNAMSTHLDRLPASSSLTANPWLTQNAATYITHFNTLISRDWSANTLSHAALPKTPQILEELSRHMADEVYRRCRLGFVPPLSPLKHPYYPFWLPEHEGNYAIEALVRKEEQELRERDFEKGETGNTQTR